MLMRFLNSLKIPVIATLRDSQNYVHAAAQGIGIGEMPAYKARADILQMKAVANWLDQRRAAIQQRQAMIEKVAYQYAEGRGFQGGDPALDWAEAEREVDSRLASENA